MMPVIIIWLILKEQLRLIFRTSPSQNELARSPELLDDAPYGFCLQIGAADLPGSTRSHLFPPEDAAFNKPFDRMMTHATDARRFVQAYPLRIG